MQKEQIQEWLESPVTELFKDLLERLRAFQMEGRSVFIIDDDPVKTHFIRARFDGNVQALDWVIDSIEEQDLSLLQIGEEDEQLGDTPDGRQSTH